MLPLLRFSAAGGGESGPLWRARGRRDQARQLPAGIVGRFTEGLGTLDLLEASALPEDLR